MPIFFDDKSLVENMREIKDDLYHDTNNIAVDRFMNIIKIAEWETFECEFKLYFHSTDVTMLIAALSRRESIGTDSANSAKFRGIRPQMYIKDLHCTKGIRISLKGAINILIILHSKEMR